MAISSNSNLVIVAAAVGTIAALAGFFALTSDDASTAESVPTTEAAQTTAPDATDTIEVATTQSPVVETTVLETITTIEVLGDDYCAVAFEFRSDLTEGPASVEVADVELYFTRNQSYYNRLVVLSPDDVAGDWVTFTEAHAGLVTHLEANSWAMSAAASYPSNAALEDSSDTVQTHLEVYCGVPGF